MAQICICDGCAKPTEIPAKLGHVIKRDYCIDCAEIASKFITDEEAERITAQASFQKKREKLIKTLGTNGFKLPDVHYAD